MVWMPGCRQLLTHTKERALTAACVQRPQPQAMNSVEGMPGPQSSHVSLSSAASTLISPTWDLAWPWSHPIPTAVHNSSRAVASHGHHPNPVSAHRFKAKRDRTAGGGPCPSLPCCYIVVHPSLAASWQRVGIACQNWHQLFVFNFSQNIQGICVCLNPHKVILCTVFCSSNFNSLTLKFVKMCLLFFVIHIIFV